MRYFARLLLWCVVFLSVFTCPVTYAAESVKIGVLSFRSKADGLAQWQTLAETMNKKLPAYHFEVEVLNFPELELAVASRQIDFVFTNPVHYVKLHYDFGLAAPLATLAIDEQGHGLTVFGGVMFSLANRSDLNDLTDIKGKTVATVHEDSIGAYQMQAYALHQAGVDLSQDVKLLKTGMTQDQVVDAVMEGLADVGFVRTGLLEAMVKEGKLDLTKIKVLNLQDLPDFPIQSSTRLYPEWAFAAMPNVDENLSRLVAATLFQLEEDVTSTSALGIRGFVVPADYTPVVDLLKALRVKPFDNSPEFTLRDVWERYRWILVLGFLSLILIVLQSLRLFMTRRELQLNHRLLLRQQEQLQESEFRWKFAIEGSGDGVWDWNVQTDEARFSKRWREMLGYSEGETLPSNAEWQERVHPEDRAYVTESIHAYLEGKSDLYVVEYRRQCKDNTYKWILSRGMAVTRSADGKPLRIIGTHIDINERKQAEEAIQLYAQVFTHAREGIVIADAEGKVIDVNDTYTQMSGYGRDELLGQRLGESAGENPAILSFSRQDENLYHTMWQQLNEHGHWTGEIWNKRKNGEVFAELKTISTVFDAQGHVKNFVALCSDITPLKEHAKQMEHIAHYDALTHLPNRVLLADRLHQAMVQAQRRNRLLAVAFLDLDGFKAINDHFGHDAGDQLLVALAIRMKQALRDGDTLSRIGGDEFVAVLLDLADVEASIPMLSRLLAAAAEPVIVDGNVLKVSASLGVTFYPQAEDIDADQLQRQADQAMYQAKQAGKNRYYIFDAKQDISVRSLHESLDRIRRALIEREFVLHYQPKVNLRSGAIIGAEALIRWQHPEKGLLLPAVFLPVIEDHPLSVEIGEWVIDTALSQLEIWHAGGLDIAVSVNIGARQLQQFDFVERLDRILLAHPNVKPSDLELELLETTALEDMVQVSQTMTRCRIIGVKFALDDFGTGYSSLSYLKRLPISMLKIDQSFVRDMLDDPDDLAILEGIVGLAEAFQRQVIAEGVETKEHGSVLLQLGCELAQGYGIARPMSAENLPEWVKTWKPEPRWAHQPALSREDIPVLFAKTQHRAWMNAVEYYLKDEREQPKSLTHDACHVGKWLMGDGLKTHGQQPCFDQVKALHQRVHELAETLCEFKQQGQDDLIFAGLKELNQMREDLLMQFNALLSHS